MKKALLISSLLIQILWAQGSHFNNYDTKDLYLKSFGKASDEPIIFLHGGPGYNSINFDETTAQKLADKGFYVVVYDRRGEGRSINLKSTYTKKETLKDLVKLMKQNKIKRAHFIGHSFGGMVATWFAKTYPKLTGSIILVGAPICLQESFKTIIRSCKKNYEAKNDAEGLKYMDTLEKMDSTSMEYASYCFYHAMKNGFYNPKNMSEPAKKIYAEFGKSPSFKDAIIMTAEAPKGFLKNENYTTIDLSEDIRSLVSDGIKVYGMYGKDDGLYSEKQVMDLKDLLGNDRLVYLDSCSHSVFMDQQDKFIQQLSAWLK